MKLERKRGYREKDGERKRFTLPLPCCLETKYPVIYEEYKDLYNSINVNNPKKRDLRKTYAFQKWKADNKRQRDEDQAAGTVDRPTPTEGQTSAEEQVAQDHTTETRTATPVDIDISSNGESDQAPTREVIHTNIEELADIMVNVEGQVQDILNELRQDPFLNNVMNNIEAEVEAQPDEGIEISPFDDIEYDIEPFNYELEVENYDW